MPTCGGLFSGAGLLDYGLHLAGWEHAWLCESDEFRRDLLRKRFPGAVVYDDVRTVRGQAAADAGGGGTGCPAEEPTRRSESWRGPARSGDGRTALSGPGRCGVSRAAPVDLIAGGFPCRGVSSAGKRQGFDNAETVLWHEMRRIIREVRPRYVLIENVAAILSMAASPGEPAGSLWGSVLADLAEIGPCHIVWDCIPAGAVGAPHLRDRLFAVAAFAAGTGAGRNGSQRGIEDGRPDAARGGHRAAADANEERQSGLPIGAGQEHAIAGGGHARQVPRVGGVEPCPTADAASGPARCNSEDTARRLATVAGRGGSSPADAARDAEGRPEAPAGTNGQRVGQSVEWGDYQPAIDRWAAIHGAAPEPLVRRMDDGDPDMQRVQSRLDRPRMRAQRQRLSALGDGVHVHVAALVGEYVMSLERARTTREAA